jgi:hypothetical protein
MTTGGKSTYKEKFDDENFLVKHRSWHLVFVLDPTQMAPSFSSVLLRLRG